MIVTKECLNCNNQFETDTKYTKKGQGLFCSVSCSTKYHKIQNKPKPNVKCALCKKEFYISNTRKSKSKSGLFFCSRDHKDQAQKLGGIKEIMPPHYGTAKVPDYSFAKKDYCERCNYNKITELLVVHHIDRDRTNNKLENLICLCPNCHDEDHFSDKTGRFWKLLRE